MTNEQQIVQNQIEMLKEIGEVKEDVAEIKGFLFKNGIGKRLAALEERHANRFATFAASGAVVISCLTVLAKLVGLW